MAVSMPAVSLAAVPRRRKATLELAREIEKRLDIPARPLPERSETTLEEFT